MSKYILRRKSGNSISYVYRTGFKATVKLDYEKFLNDLVSYANVKAEDIETQTDLIELFDKAKKRGFDFGKTSDSKNALIDEWERRGFTFRTKRETRQKHLEEQLESELDTDKKVKIQRKIIRVRERGKIVTKEEYRVLFNWAFK